MARKKLIRLLLSVFLTVLPSWALAEAHSHGCEYHWTIASYRQEMYIQLSLIVVCLALLCAAHTIWRCLRRKST